MTGVQMIISGIIVVLLVLWLLGTAFPIGKYIDRLVMTIRRTLPDGFNGDDKQDKDNGNTADGNGNDNMEEKFDNPVEERMIRALQNMQCDIQNRNEGACLFEYQGELFAMYTAKDSLWVNLRDPNWHTVPLDDIDELAIVRKTVNNVNWHSTGRFVYYIDEEERTMRLDLLYSFILFKEIADLESVLRALLSIFFREKTFFMKQLEEERSKAKK